MDNEILDDIIRRAKKLGADHADVLYTESKTISATTRLAKLEKLVQADVVNIKIRLSVENKTAIVATDNLDEMNETSFVEKAVFAAKNAPEEIIQFRPSVDELCKNLKKIDMCDNRDVSPDELVSNALECEDTALQIHGITNSEGSEAYRSCSKITLARDNDFFASYKKTYNQTSIVILAEKDGFLERDYDFSETIYYEDLKTPKEIAKSAAERTVKRIGAKKIPSCKASVVFDKRCSCQLLRSLLMAINGAAVAKGTSFLKNKLSQKIFSDSFNITDRCAVQRGLRSRPFDSDGLECCDNSIIKNGVLNTFLLNTKYANQLKMRSTCNAYGFEGIAPNNICIENGSLPVGDLLKSMKNGLYVTEVLGNGLNLVTGNYSQGAVGFWIENGEISYPVNEITIAGNYIDMLSNCNIASDLEIKSGIDSPTLFIDEMIIGGI